MGLIHTLPLPVRLPLIRTALAAARAAREPAWRKVRPSHSPGPLVVSGFLGEALGIGRAGDATADALQAAGFALERQSLRTRQRAVWSLGKKPAVTGRPGGVWLIHANAPEAEVALMTHDPADWAGRYRIGYWAWETTEAPSDWTRVAPWFDEIWAPSQFTADAIAAAFARAGRAELSNRLRVMPHPVTPPEPTPGEAAALDLEPGATHALVMFDGRSAFARKNPWGAIEAWVRAFPQARPGVRLLIKGSNLAIDPVSRQRLADLTRTRSDIRLIEMSLSEADLWRLLADIDLLISLHRGEGFGLVAAEAMSLGRPVLMTGWSGVTDFADDTSAAMVPYRLISARDPSGAYRQGQWAEPDIDAAARMIRDLIDHPDHARLLGARGPGRIAQLNTAWSPTALAKMAFASLIDNSDRRPVL
ncbi:MAG: glycosyltransferase family 4 protein [Caulobacterales bacterium]|nr:glycosyltransferase family 4 protein [Caulobacterales bacterium]